MTTQYYAAFVNATIAEKIEGGDDYVTYGTAKQIKEFVEDAIAQNAISDMKPADIVTIYKIKKQPEFVDAASLSAIDEVKEAAIAAKGKVEGKLEELDLPKNPEELTDKIARLKQQAQTEGASWAAGVAATIFMKAQQGIKDPKQLASEVKDQAVSKAAEVSSRVTEFAKNAAEEGKTLVDELKGDAAETIKKAEGRFMEVDPDAIRLQDGSRQVRVAYLIQGTNAQAVSLATLRKTANKAPKRAPKP